MGANDDDFLRVVLDAGPRDIVNPYAVLHVPAGMRVFSAAGDVIPLTAGNGDFYLATDFEDTGHPLAGLLNGPVVLFIEGTTHEAKGILSFYYGGVEDAVSLLPVEITVRKKGEEVPPDGVVVKTADVLDIRFNDMPPEHFPLPRDQLVWEYRQLRGDGTWGSSGSKADDAGWQAFGEVGKGVRFDYTTIQGGIFQLRARLTTDGETQTYYFQRKKDAEHATDSHSSYNEHYRKGKNDYFGVADTTTQINLRATAKAFLGQTIFSQAGDYPFFPDCPSMAGKSKCNMFIFLMGNAAGCPVPRDWDGSGWFGAPVMMPPLAKHWFDSSRTIQNWTWLSETTFPQPGYVVSHVGKAPGDIWSNSVHHSGVLDYDGAWINAGDLDVNKWPHIGTTPIVIPGHYRKFTGAGGN
jgi:hypothetical protein